MSLIDIFLSADIKTDYLWVGHSGCTALSSNLGCVRIWDAIYLISEGYFANYILGISPQGIMISRMLVIQFQGSRTMCHC